MNHDYFIDIKNMCCAEPVVRLTKQIKSMKSGDILLAESDKDSMLLDIPAYCQQTKHELLEAQENNGLFHFWIKIK